MPPRYNVTYPQKPLEEYKKGEHKPPKTFFETKNLGDGNILYTPRLALPSEGILKTNTKMTGRYEFLPNVSLETNFLHIEFVDSSSYHYQLKKIDYNTRIEFETGWKTIPKKQIGMVSYITETVKVKLWGFSKYNFIIEVVSRGSRNAELVAMYLMGLEEHNNRVLVCKLQQKKIGKIWRKFGEEFEGKPTMGWIDGNPR